MQIKSINIRRLEGYELANTKGVREFKADICIVGGKSYSADINIRIPEEMLEPIVGIIAQAAAEAMTGATQQFHKDVQAMLTGPAIEQITEQVPA